MAAKTGEIDVGPILIIGAGCTGLALAQGLKRAGVKSIVFEQQDTISTTERDWNMGMHWGAPHLQSLMHPEHWDMLQSLQADPNAPTKDEDILQFLNGQSGELLGGFPANKFYRLRRSKLRSCLAQGLDIRFGMTVKSISYSSSGSGVSARFVDGSSFSGSLVVGADGPRSTVRELLLGREKSAQASMPYAATFVQSKYSRDQALHLRHFHPLYIASSHPLGRFAFFGMHDAPNPNEPESWTFFSTISWYWTSEQQEESKRWNNGQKLDHIKKLAEDFVDPWKSAHEWLPADTPAWHLGFKSWDPSEEAHQWDNKWGRVTLAGDAAHTMTYQRGQGLNHSLADASKLRDAIVEFSKKAEAAAQAAAISEYEKEMIVRSGEEVRTSAMNTKMIHDWTLLQESPLMRAGMRAGVESSK